MKSLSWIFYGEDAEEFEKKLLPHKKPQPLVIGSRHPMPEVHKLIVENARKRKEAWNKIERNDRA